MVSYTISIEDKRNGERPHTTLDELSWEKLWEALFIYDGDVLRRAGKKFYIVTSEAKERCGAQIEDCRFYLPGIQLGNEILKQVQDNGEVPYP